jgi:hypothetical protein
MNYKPILLAALLWGALGCSVITDFPADWIDDTNTLEKYALSENISEDVPVEVKLLDNENARVTLNLLSPLPEAEEGDSELASLLGDAIGLIVQNTQEGGTSVDLTQGTLVSGTPDNAGEYLIELGGGRSVITITFRNETTSGKSLSPEGSYEAMISVQTNPYFEAEDFVRDIEVTN